MRSLMARAWLEAILAGRDREAGRPAAATEPVDLTAGLDDLVLKPIKARLVAAKAKVLVVCLDDELHHVPVELLPSAKGLELRFAAMSYRDPGRLRYQERLGDDADWIDTRLPSFHFVDLPPGIYSAEARASLDGTAWTPQPARLAFVVLEPWYRTWWALASFGLAGLVLLYAIHRTRIAVLMRLERQRTRIAMDLHDELGSGLGSVGILAEIVRDGALDDRQRRGLGAEILEGTGELQAALSSIVWALRPGAGTLSALAPSRRPRLLLRCRRADESGWKRNRAGNDPANCASAMRPRSQASRTSWLPARRM